MTKKRVNAHFFRGSFEVLDLADQVGEKDEVCYWNRVLVGSMLACGMIFSRSVGGFSRVTKCCPNRSLAG